LEALSPVQTIISNPVVTADSPGTNVTLVRYWPSYVSRSATTNLDATYQVPPPVKPRFHAYTPSSQPIQLPTASPGMFHVSNTSSPLNTLAERFVGGGKSPPTFAKNGGSTGQD